MSRNEHQKFKTWKDCVAVWQSYCLPGNHNHPSVQVHRSSERASATTTPSSTPFSMSSCPSTPTTFLRSTTSKSPSKSQSKPMTTASPVPAMAHPPLRQGQRPDLPDHMQPTPPQSPRACRATAQAVPSTPTQARQAPMLAVHSPGRSTKVYTSLCVPAPSSLTF